MDSRYPWPQFCLPRVNYPYLYLPHVPAPAGIERVQVPYHLGRNTFAALKVARGVPRAQLMTTTSYQTEACFSHCLGVNEAELLAWYQRTARLAA